VARNASIPRSPQRQIDEQDGQGRTQLHQAVIQNSMDQVRALLSSGAQVDIRDNFNNDPLHLAVGQDEVNKEIVKMLLDYGACPDSPGEGRKTSLHISVKSKSTLKLLLKAGPNLSGADLRGNTALHDAALCDDKENPDCFVELLSYGADVNALNSAGQTPFHLVLDRAATVGSSRIVTALEHGADVLKLNEHNQVPLQILAKFLKYLKSGLYEWFRAIELFSDKGASLDVQLRSGDYLSHFLIRQYLWSSHGELVCRHANPLIRGQKGNTVLHELIGNSELNSLHLIDILLNRGADPNVENNAGVTPFCLLFNRAKYNQFVDFLKAVETFLGSGANPLHGDSGDLPVYVAARIIDLKTRTKALNTLLTGFAKRYGTFKLPQTMKGLCWWQNYVASLRQAENGDWAGADNRFQEDDSRLPEDVDEHIRTTARIVLAENTLKHHKAAILGKPEGQTHSEQELGDIRRNVVATLRGCRAYRIPIDPTFYQLLLDVID